MDPNYGQSGPMGQPPTGPMGQPPTYGQTGPMGQPPTGPMGQPGYGQTGPMGPGAYMATPVMVAQQPPNKGLAIALEVIGGLFGLYGIGWLVARVTSVGVILLISGIIANIIMWSAVGFLGVITIGIGFILAVCPPVVNIIVMVISTIMLNGRLNRAAGGAPAI
ncbi:MAG: hypothetical protein ABI068_06525 [Ktedonobacterales bacterium]